MKLTPESKEVYENLHPGDIAIDCGANTGWVTLRMAERGATVYAFEPNPHMFDFLRIRFFDNPKVYCRNQGVWDRNGKMRLYLYPGSDTDPISHAYASSIFGNNPIIDPNLYVDIEVIDLTEFISHLKSRIKLLKIDIEGAEFELLEKIIDLDMYNIIDKIVVETHEWLIPDSQQKLDNIKRKIQDKGIHNIDLNWI
ncbi:FkbM family methyltransferase [Paenibacillus alkalitolerans]|uniref:FkbM family methyltransferase n=1 Tax=Paenibacillus alkalitolerans TaxID=2799335 RepID=UPI0018F5D696|nr:FkbM family methyltransferase [Paenibacillus alkalitolerans]